MRRFSLTLILCAWLMAAFVLPASFAQELQDYLEEASLFLGDGQYEEAIAKYEEAIAVDPKSALAYHLLGIAYRFQFSRTGDPAFTERQIEAFEKAIAVDPDYWPVLTHLGIVYDATGEAKKAATVLKKVLELHPNHPERFLYDPIIAKADPDWEMIVAPVEEEVEP